MLKFFYADCVVSDVKYIRDGGSVTYVVTAKIDGRETKECIMDKTMYEYFNGLGAGTKNRIWFMTAKSGLIFKVIENQAGERLVSKITAKAKFDDFIRVPFAINLFTIPCSISFGGPKLFYFGLCASAVILLMTVSLHKKLGNYEAWPAGDVSAFTSAVFGAGLGSLKKDEPAKPSW